MSKRKSKSATPVMDKYNLHSVGGYCTCFSNPYSRCLTCERCAALKARWDALSPKNRKLADAEYESTLEPDIGGR